MPLRTKLSRAAFDRNDNQGLALETLEDRIMLSTIQVYAAGATGEEQMNLAVNGSVVQTWNNIGGDYLGGSYQTYSYNTAGNVTADQVRVSFSNDGLTASGGDRNLRVDRINIDGVDYQSEAPDTYIEGTWQSAIGCSAGNLQSEYLHCGGFIQYAAPAGSGSVVVVRMAGATGEENVALSIGGQVVRTFTNVGGDYLNPSYIDYTYTHSSTVTPDQVRVEHINDGLTASGEDKNLRLDRISIDGVNYEAEDPGVFVTGHWIPGTGCAEGNLQTETTQCGGYFQFAADTNSGSTVIVRAAGATGEEQVRLKIDGAVVQTWNNVAGNYIGATYENLTYEHPTQIDIQQIVVEFSNDGLTAGGQDRNLRLDSVSVDGNVVQAESPSVYSEGHWVSGVGCAAGFIETETLQCGGLFDFNAAAYDAGNLSFSTNLVNVNEDGSSVTVSVVRTQGSNGVVSVDYRTIENTAIVEGDFGATFGTLTFGDGETVRNITVPIINDTLAEGDESFSVTIDNPLGGVELLAPRTVQIVINDDDVPSTSELLAHWKLDETEVGSVANTANANSTGTHLNMTSGTSGPSLITPLLNQPNGRSLNFDGVNDYVRITNPQLNFTSGTFTIAAWIRPTFTDTGVHGIYYGGNQHYPGLYVTGQDRLALRFGDGTNYNTLTTGSALTTDDWNHVAAVFDGTAMRIYVNGQVQATSNAFAGFTPVAAGNVDIGRRGSGYFAGQIDDVQIHDGALSGSQVGKLAVPQTTNITSEVVANVAGTVAIDFTPDGSQMFIGDFSGLIRIQEGGGVLPTPFIDISNQVNGTRGMLDIAVHPNFPATPYVYLAFAYDPPEVFQNTGLAGPNGAGNRASRLIRVTADASDNYRTAVPGSEVVLLGTNSTWQNFNGFVDSTIDFDEPPAGINPDGTNLRDFLAADSQSHTIGDIEFGPDGALYVSNGDGASYNQADPRAVRVQDIDNLSGKVLRIDPISGAGLPDNPFYNGDSGANRSRVYYYGLRNPYRMTFNDATGQLYVGDVGWFQYEELNTGAPGTNFGWPFFEGGTVDTPLRTIVYQDLPEAIAFYASGQQTSGGLLSLSHADEGIDALIAGDFYDGGVYGAEYEGDLFFNYLGSGFVRHVSFNTDGSIQSIKTFADRAGYIVQMKVGPDGHLYFVDLTTGNISRWLVG